MWVWVYECVVCVVCVCQVTGLGGYEPMLALQQSLITESGQVDLSCFHFPQKRHSGDQTHANAAHAKVA